jgi:hypothetical protein
MTPFSCPSQRAHLHKILQIPCCRGARSARDCNVVLGTQPAFEALGSFAEQALDHFCLPFVQPVAELVVELCFGDEKGNALERDLLCLEDGLGEPQEPCGDVCVFRGDPASDSESIRPPIPILSGH